MFGKPKATDLVSNGPAWLDTAPEITDLVIGYRASRLGRTANGAPALIGSHGGEWTSPEFTAECEGDWQRCRVHLARGSACSCGIYAYRNREQLGTEPLLVHAEVVMAGWVIPGTSGWRSEWARIQRLWLYGEEPERWATYWRDELARVFEVPVELATPSLGYPPDEAYFRDLRAQLIAQVTTQTGLLPGGNLSVPMGALFR